MKTKKKVFTSFDVQFTLQNKVKAKNGLYVFCRPIYPPKSSEDQKKGQRVLRCSVSSVSLTANIRLNFCGGEGRDSSGPPEYIPVIVITLESLYYWCLDTVRDPMPHSEHKFSQCSVYIRDGSG